jgi:hypothetical protein
MQALQQKVEEAEEAAQQAKKDALHSGSDILAQVDEMREMLSRAREANEMVFAHGLYLGEISGLAFKLTRFLWNILLVSLKHVLGSYSIVLFVSFLALKF